MTEFPKVQINQNLNVPCDYNGAVCSLYFYVYTYTDPKKGNLVYVGKGTNYRAWTHLNSSHNKKLDNLLSKRQKEGYFIRPAIVQFFEHEIDAYDLEKDLIQKYGRVDTGTGVLFNRDEGGAEAIGNTSSIEIEFRGETFPSKAALCRKYEINEATFRGRIELNWSMAQALGLEEKSGLHGAKEIQVDDQKWPSLSLFAEDVGATPGQIRWYLDKGLLPKDLIGRDFSRRHGTEIILGDKHFPSIVEFSKFCQKSTKAVAYWLETGWTPEEIYENKISNRGAVYTVWNDAAITQSEFTKICNISFTTLIKYRNKGLSNEEIFALGQRPLSEKLMGIRFELHGVVYPTLTEFNNAILQLPMSTASKWINHFGLSEEQCFEAIKLARKISFSQETSWRGCLSQATKIIRGLAPLHVLEGYVVTQSMLRQKAKISDVVLRRKLDEGLSAEEIIVWSETNRGKSTKIEPFVYENQTFYTYTQFDRFLGATWGYTAKCNRNGYTLVETEEIVKNAKAFMKSGMTEGRAYHKASREFSENKKGGKKLEEKVAHYIRLRRNNLDPKIACEKVGLSKSNSSRLEKTHKELIDNPHLFLRTK